MLPLHTLVEQEGPPLAERGRPEDDGWVYRMVLGFAGLMVLICVLGALFHVSADAPLLMLALGSAAVGTLTALLLTLLVPGPGGRD